MKFDEASVMLGKIIAEFGKEGQDFAQVFWAMESALDETNDVDFFGTQGWKYALGLED